MIPKYFFVLLIVGVVGVFGQQPDICPPPAHYWPHPVNCTLFYICNPWEGDHFLDYCPSGLYWNQDVISCDWPMNVPECREGTRPTSMPNTTTTTTPIPTTLSTTASTITTTPFPDSEFCPPDYVGFWPHRNCSMFYNCLEDGDYELFYCPEGTYFIPDMQVCGPPIYVPSCIGGTNRPPSPSSTTTMPTSTSTTTTSTTTTTTTTPPTTTTIMSTSTSISTLPPSTTINTTQSTTSQPNTTTTTTTPPPSNECPQEGTIKIPHEELCEAFWLCVDGDRLDQLYFCPGGLLFDPIEQKCNLPSEVDCDNN